MNNLGLLFALGAAVTWGIIYTVDQKILVQISPMNLLFLNGVITMILTLPFFLMSKESRHLVSLPSNTIYLVFLSVALGVLAGFFIYSGIRLLGAGMASIFEISYPLFVTLFTLLFLGESPTPYFWLGSVLMVAGAGIILRFG